MAGLALAAILLACVALPLATFTLVLALFGPAHVASELRYVDHRFGARLGPARVQLFAVLFASAMAARLLGMVGILPVAVMAALEIGLAAAATLALATAPGAIRWGAAILGLGLVLGATLAPLLTLLAMAVTHNLTPLGFLAERLSGAARRRAMILGVVGFLVIPAVIASGWPFDKLAALGWVAPEWGMFPLAGSLDDNLLVYLPARALAEPWALHVFSAVVFAQCMHYVAVIGVLPALIEPGSRPVLPWPAPRHFVPLLIAGAAAAFAAFSLDYALARKAYAIVALLHAWLELPLLVLSLQPGYRAATA